MLPYLVKRIGHLSGKGAPCLTIQTLTDQQGTRDTHSGNPPAISKKHRLEMKQPGDRPPKRGVDTQNLPSGSLCVGPATFTQRTLSQRRFMATAGLSEGCLPEQDSTLHSTLHGVSLGLVLAVPGSIPNRPC